ncbi:GNAT family N-acetyltransferase [Niveispirillum sp.]|uniref:GNAT family N-acetyltransferase n=1 Tax=Niveispirillum sp. TaxID=1917217 RepID=UPI001B60AF8A|nr:GNAT family N-acetyltransferase [Niveispirillum sp.]MBP7336176.1 GNAT family N-acetyltransferase [Niveispirillum sp.]
MMHLNRQGCSELWLDAPTVLVRAGYGLRREGEQDLPFLRTLYASTRAEEMRASGWTKKQQEVFLAEQFRLQDAHYRREFPDTVRQIVVKDAQPVGRLYLRRVNLPLPARPEIRVNDIALLPVARSQGIGSALMKAVLEIAAAEGLIVSLTVYEDNRALNLYHRLGFHGVTRENGRLLMRWRPQAG